jgi:putative ATP-binding cassette transporter
VGRVSCRTVQGAFNWLVDNYQRLADWRSSAHRVATLLIALDELEAKEMPKSPPSQQQ